MGAAWRDMNGRKRGFERILKMVEGVRCVLFIGTNLAISQTLCPCDSQAYVLFADSHSAMDMEVCTTLGMLSPEQAQQLKQAGLTAYNHNLDTSREFYPSVITTRKYDERLETIEAVRAAGLSVCSGGIVGLGEKDGDRVGLIYEMSQCVSRPASVSGLRLADQVPLEELLPQAGAVHVAQKGC